MSILEILLQLKAEEITGIVGGVCAGIVSIIAAIGNIINNKRREEGNMKCCITGRKLKPRKPKTQKPTTEAK